MDKSVAVLFTIIGIALTALAAFAVYRWRERRRHRGVDEKVGAYLRDRFGAPLDQLIVNCSDDRNASVLVSFDDPRTGLRHRLRFACPGSPATLSLHWEDEAKV